MKTTLTLLLVYIGIALACGIGWVINIVKIVGMLHEPITAFFVARVVGVFAAPLGAVLGYM